MLVEVSHGELVDKVSILAIKLERVKSPGKLRNIQREFDALVSNMRSIGIDQQWGQYLELYRINSKIWEIEDAIRMKEAKKEFDHEFIEFARQVYFNNDRRSQAKRAIDEMTRSAFREEKEYFAYDK